MIKKKIRMDEAGTPEVPVLKASSRVDWMMIPDDMDYMQEKMVKTPEGYLKGKAIVTNVGVFPYKQADGSVINELRPPEEVFHPDSIASLCMQPIVNNHPTELVNAENIQKYQVGHLGDNVLRDAYHLAVPVVITDAKSVEDAQGGKQALSCGYTVDIEQKSGNWLGVPYQAIQRNIRYNHVALVDQARAGDAACLKMDQAIGTEVFNLNKKKINLEDSMKKVKIDGVEYEAEAKVIETLTKADSRIDELTKQSEKDKTENLATIQTLQGKLDSAIEAGEKLKKDMADLEAKGPTSIDEAVNAKLALMDSARKVGVEVKADMKDEDIRKAVIVKAFPKAVEKLDKADPAYISARFDAAVEMLVTDEENRVDNRAATGDLIHAGETNNDSGEVVVDSATSRQKMIDEMKNRSKPASENK